MANNQQRTNIWIDGSQAGATLTDLKKKVSILNKEIKDLPRNSDDYKRKVVELKEAGKALDVHKNQIRGIGDSYAGANKGIGGMMRQFAPMAGGLAIAGAAISGIVGGISSWYQNNKQMEKSLSSLQSLTGASTEDLKFYKQEAIEMGKASTVSASQAVEAFKLIGSARPDLLKNKEALAEVTKQTIVLAEASEMDLGASATSLAGAMNQFNLSAEHSGRIINALAAGSKEGAAEVSDVTQSIEKFGAVAQSNNITFEESVALTEVMAEKNIKGAEAGTQLRNVLLTVATAASLPKEAQDSMKKYGVNLDIVSDKSLPLKDRLNELKKVQGDQNALVKIFGKENVVAGQTILGNVEKFDTLTKAVTGTNTAYEQQRINNDNLDGDLKKMDSAWEGLTLSIGGGGDAMRGVVQVGTDVLNWTSDLITALKEGDSMALETQFLKLADALTFGIGPLHDYYEEAIRINEISMSIIDSVKGEIEANEVLTGSLIANKKAMEDSNITEEQKNRLQEENNKIVDTLNEKYPELTKNLDLHKMSTKDLIKLQKEMNNTLMEQALTAATAAESQRILGVIVENTLKKQTLQAEIVRLSKKGDVFSKYALYDKVLELADANKEILTANKQMKTLGTTMQAVKDSVKGIDFSFGSKFTLQADIIANSQKELRKLQAKLKATDDPRQREVLEANIKGLKASIGAASKDNQASLDALINKTEEVAIKDGEVTEQVIGNSKKRGSASSDADKKKLADLNKELERITEFADKTLESINYEKALDSFATEKEEEYAILTTNLDKKYQAEIQSAGNLMTEKGDLGLKATEQYNRLIAMEDEEYEKGRAEIEKKYSDKSKAEKLEAEKTANLQLLAQQETLQNALVDLKVTKAKIALNAVLEGDLSGYRLAKENLEKALKEQAELEKTRKIEALIDLQAESVISAEELNVRKEELELEYQARVVEIGEETAEKLKEIDDKRLEDTLANMQEVISIASSLSDSQSKIQLNKLDKEQKIEMNKLNNQLRNKSISEEEYNAKKKKIEEEYAQKKYEVELEQFKKNQAFASAEAIIQGALAIAKVTAQTGVAAPFAIPLVVASTAAQVIAILAQAPPEAPQFVDGGYSDVIGKQDGLRYRAKNVGRMKAGLTPMHPSLALVSEKGPEYFVPNGLLRNQRVARHVAMIDAIRTNQYVDGGFTQQASLGSNDELTAVLKQNNQLFGLLAQTIPTMGIKWNDGDTEDLEKNQSRLARVKN